MTRWTLAQVEEAAPDPASVKAASKLAHSGPWSDTGSTDTLVWGKCQGSGSKAYQITVDLTGPAFKCTCPSRKFPCKHGLALLMLWVKSDGSIADAAEAADFADEWVSERNERTAKSNAKKAAQSAPDPAAQAKRRAQRVELMSAGIEEFHLWLTDLVRQGFAAVRSRPNSFWEQAAGRLVDAQLPGLAERVRHMSSEIHREHDWADILLSECGRWNLAIEAWRRCEHLDADDQANLRTYVGWTTSTDDVRSGETVTDEWCVLGTHRTEEGKLQAQRTWIFGRNTGTQVLLLDFAAGGALRVPSTVGTVIDSTLALYPGSGLRRAMFTVDPAATGRINALPAGAAIGCCHRSGAAHLAANPFAFRTPMVASSVRFTTSGATGVMLDEHDHQIGLAAGAPHLDLLALTGGQSVDVFGELEGGEFRPLTLQLDSELVAV